MGVTFDHECPYCCSDEIYKSRFRVMDWVVMLLLLRPVRCGICLRRYWRPLLYGGIERYTRARVGNHGEGSHSAA